MTEVKCQNCGNIVQVPKGSGTSGWLIGCLVAAVVGIVGVAVVGLLAAIAIPSFVKARNTAQMNACINNMRQIDSAKEQAAIKYSIKDGAEVPIDQVSEFVAGGLGARKCVAGGVYKINPLGESPECSLHGSMDAPVAHPGRR
ncbi:MAG: hypothetical protein C0404_03925 [Verrucomicrobia bacterium]|nr:hypothetical protein [Verrucomicrobiota bacterium]